MTADLGIYVHWPYCAAKCPYCDFNSHVRETFSEKRWSEAIGKELAAVADLQGAERPIVTSIFFGGGTPSLMSGRAASYVLDRIGGLWTVAADAEITLEANPNSVEQARFSDYRAAGINRVSIGVQALEDRALKALGRLHGAEEARSAIRIARDTFPRVNFDLIYARPGQTGKEWEDELKQALDFDTEHLSVYQLTIEPGTAFATLARQGRLETPGDEAAASFYELTQDILGAAGLPAYEISNHARAGAESRHNLLYWRYGDYAGVGPGAHGRLTIGEERFATEAQRLPERWLADVEAKGTSLTLTGIAPADSARENLLMSLRLSEGIDLVAYEARWGVAPLTARIAELEEAGLVTCVRNRLAASPRGRLVLNAIIARLLEQ